MDSEREVERERGLNVADQFKIDKDLFFEISAKDGTGFDEFFEAVVQEIRESGGSNATPTASMPPSTSGSRCCKT